MLKKIIYILLVIFFVAIEIYTQEINPIFKRITVDDGLSQSSINTILQDKYGFMWFGTQDGLNRFDGYEFKVFKNDPSNKNSLSDNYVWKMCEDNNGIIWLGGFGGGLIKFDPVEEIFTHFSFEQLLGDSAMNTSTISSIVESPAGILWLGTELGLLKVDTENMETIKIETSIPYLNVSSIVPYNKENIWFISSRGLSRLNTKTNELNFYTEDPFNSNIRFGTLYDIAIDEDDVLLLCSSGLVKLNFKEKTSNIVVDVQPNKNFKDKLIFQNIFVDEDGFYWIGTNNGLLLYEKNIKKITHFTHNPNDESSLIHNNIISIFKSKDNVRWIGSRIGLTLIEQLKPNFSLIKKDPGKENTLSYKSVGPILEGNNGILWLGTPDGLNALNNKTSAFIHFRFNPAKSNSLKSSYILSLCEDRNGNVWVGTRNGGLNKIILNDAAELNNVSIKRFTSEKFKGLSSNTIQTIFIDKENIIWLGTGGGGLVRFDPVKNEFKSFKQASDGTGPIHSYIYSIYEDSYSNFWVGSVGGLNLFNKESGRFIYFQHNSKNVNSLSNNIILCIREDLTQNIMWFGTSNGLNKFANRLKENLFDELNKSRNLDNDSLFIRYGNKHGLPNEVIYGILQDNKSNLWLSTNKGISNFDPAAENAIKNYDELDGLQDNEFNQRAFFNDKLGYMYFGGIEGLNIFHPDSILQNSFVPPVYFTDLKLFNESVPVNSENNSDVFTIDKSITYLDELHLSYDQNVISLDFAALSFVSPSKNEYKYLLDGFDREWSSAVKKRSVTYTNLDPGEYIFKVKASNNDGIWNSKGANLKIIIHPPPWLSWYAYLFYISAFLSAVFLFIRIKINSAKREMETLNKIELAKQHEREEVRRKSSADFHDEAGNKLTKITLFTELAKRESENNPSVKEYLEKIEENTKEISTGMRDFIWVLDPSRDSLADTINRLADFGNSMFGFTNVIFNIKGVTDDYNNVNLSMELRRAIMLIFKEAMNNCLKYSQAKNVVLSVSLNNIILTLRLEDDGIGFNCEEKAEGYGLKNMASRAVKNNADLEIDSKPNGGTTISFNVNLTHMGD